MKQCIAVLLVMLLSLCFPTQEAISNGYVSYAAAPTLASPRLTALPHNTLPATEAAYRPTLTAGVSIRLNSTVNTGNNNGHITHCVTAPASCLTAYRVAMPYRTVGTAADRLLTTT